MRVMRKDFSWAVSEGVIAEGQAEELWRVLKRRDTDRPRFDLAHVAYYFGALIVIGAMTWFMTLGWERFGGEGILAISLTYALGFVVAGGLLWRDMSLKVPGGLLVTGAVCMTPLAVYGFEEMTGVLRSYSYSPALRFCCSKVFLILRASGRAMRVSW